ncbi:hypothetical protein KFK14_23655 [Sphingobium phenoxybenzoativorans]|uniref:Uncharacterized protein n=1 Tax=Sphingobium phenoxybenzoativorans TaxID=1592790 RepID=A0A975K6V3_9SPHN|nr:hypothetical protein [Sphingobium phenoxybenzoativorans]QUT05888.1 hypothetical protein KFK14_23655 [Sphingobium phenoxybenzoativorans]
MLKLFRTNLDQFARIVLFRCTKESEEIGEHGVTKGEENLHGTKKSAVAALVSPTERPLRSVIEREILRVVSIIPVAGTESMLRASQKEVLRWARKRAGAVLPEHAWQGAPFEMLAAGRTTMGTNVETESGFLWSLRGDDPDKSVPGRIWSTEVSLGQPEGSEEILLGVRLLVNSAEAEVSITPSVPGLVLQIADNCGLRDGPIPVLTKPYYAETESDADTLIDWLLSDTRRNPIIVASGDERSEYPARPLIDVESLAKSLCGLAHVVSLPANLTYKLNHVLGKELMVFHGGVRIYEPRLYVRGDPRDHRLYLGNSLITASKAIEAEIRSAVARVSLRVTRLGHDVLPFAAVRSAALRLQQRQQIADGASDSVQLAAANDRSDALELEVDGLRAEVDQALELSLQEADRAEDAEKQLASAWARIEQLEAALKSNGTALEEGNTQPDDWSEFGKWCDDTLSSRLSLSSTARRSIRKPDFEDISLAARCLQWLANEARNRFLRGGGALANIPVFEGVTNAPCGADEYQFDFQGRRLSANWHIKNGGNTRQPERCLRIYYAFDEVSRQIIVSDMPGHRRTGAT